MIMQSTPPLKSATNWLAWTLLLLCSLSGAFCALIEWSGNDRSEGILDTLFALTPVLAALPASTVMYIFLHFGSRRATGVWWDAFGGALLVGGALLWLFPMVADPTYRLSTSSWIQLLLVPLRWANFELPGAFWLVFWLGNGLGAYLGYVASQRGSRPAHA